MPIDPAAVTTWPAAIVSIAGLVYLIVQQARQARLTRRVEHEVTNNSGSSMKDSLDRIEDAIEKIDTHIADEPKRRRRGRREAALMAAVGTAVSIAVTLSRR